MTGERLRRYAKARDALLENVASALEADERVEAAWLAGSVGRGEGDDWTDLDLHVAIRDDALSSFLADRASLYESLGTVVMVQDEIPGQPGVGDQFHLVHFATPAGPAEIDWSYLPASEARKPLGHRVLFEKRRFPVSESRKLSPEERRADARRWAMFFWAMAPIAVRLCGRGDLERAVAQVRLLRRALINLWPLLEAGATPWDPEANHPLDERYAARIPELKQPLSLLSLLDVIDAHCAQAEALHEDLRALSAAIDPAIVGQTRELIVTAREEIGAGRFIMARKYR